MKTRSDLDYIIVLGAHVRWHKITLALLERVRRALLYLEENPGTKAVLSGGRGDGRADQRGGGHVQISYRTWDCSRTSDTRRTVNQYERKSGFQSALIGSTEHSIGVVTNNFHVFRGVAIGKKCGCRKFYPIPSKISFLETAYLCPREILAILKDKIVGNL